MTDNIEATGVAGSGLVFQRPLPENTSDGAKIVYVSIPNEDSLTIATERWEMDQTLSPRIHAMNMALNYRDFQKRELAQIIHDAAQIERYLVDGTVPEIPEGGEGDA